MPYQIVAIHTQDGSPLDLLSNTWLQKVPSAASQYKVLKICGPAASRTNPSFSQTVGGRNVALISGIGHGSDAEFVAYGGIEVLYSTQKKGVPRAEVAGKIVHLLSCSTAKGLDAAFISAGCLAFIGYQNLVTFGNNDVNINIATSDAQVEISLSQGRCVSDAIKDAQKCYYKLGLDPIGKLLVSNPQNCTLKLPGAPGAVAPAILWENTIPARSTPAPNNIAIRAS